jgi:hypothetical protein
MTVGVAPSSGRESENLVNSPNLLSTSVVPPFEVAVRLVALDTDTADPETYPHGPFGRVSLR